MLCAWHQAGGGLYVTICQSHWYKSSVLPSVILQRKKREPGGLFPRTLCLGQLFDVRVLQVAAEDLVGCGEALVCKAQHYCSAKRNVIGIWD